jgi:hypothetical protein
MISFSLTGDSRRADALVSAIVAEFGFDAAIPWLLDTLAKLAESSLAAPADEKRKPRFAEWSTAIQSACTREGVRSR